MPRRSGDGLSDPGARLTLAALGLLVLVVGGCETDGGNAGCQLTQVVVLTDSPLTLLPSARLDRVGNDFVLIGSDGTAVRWASVSNTGVLGPEHAVPLPVGAAAPRFALAGTNQPADRVLVSYLMPAANEVDSELRVMASAFDGSAPGEPGPPLITFVGGVAMAPPMLEMGSSREGMAAGLAWFDQTVGAVRFVTLDGAGEPLGEPATGEAGDAFSCLGFSAGKNDLTFAYDRYLESAAPKVPSILISEAQESGRVDHLLRLTVAMTVQNLTCSIVASTSTGYATAWQDYSGSWLAIFSDKLTPPISYPFASATDFGGPALQPPLKGLAQFGNDFGVVLAKPKTFALWRLNELGQRQPGELVFPSLTGNRGEISVIQSGSAIVATYADYTDTDHASGRRVFLKAACY
jgi:hypothetical protein